MGEAAMCFGLSIFVSEDLSTTDVIYWPDLTVNVLRSLRCIIFASQLIIPTVNKLLSQVNMPWKLKITNHLRTTPWRNTPHRTLCDHGNIAVFKMTLVTWLKAHFNMLWHICMNMLITQNDSQLVIGDKLPHGIVHNSQQSHGNISWLIVCDLRKTVDCIWPDLRGFQERVAILVIGDSWGTSQTVSHPSIYLSVCQSVRPSIHIHIIAF